MKYHYLYLGPRFFAIFMVVILYEFGQIFFLLFLKKKNWSDTTAKMYKDHRVGPQQCFL